MIFVPTKTTHFISSAVIRCQEKTTKKPYFSGFRPFISQYLKLNMFLIIELDHFPKGLLLDNNSLTSIISLKNLANFVPEKSLSSCSLLITTIRFRLKTVANKKTENSYFE